jgi:DNA helicase HerA-like ATPase
MIQDKKERCIAKIVSINAYKLEAELLSDVKSFNINGFEDIYQFIRLNGYVLIGIENNYIVASISSIREKDDNTGHTDKDALNKVNSNKILDLFPLGVLEKNKFTFGVSNYPMLYSDVLYIKDKELDILFSGGKDNDYLEIGNWTLMDKYKVAIDIDNFFGFHSAILGNTGSGKSCTISAILQGIYEENKYPKSQFIFFDVNGEYRKAFSGNKNISLNYLDFDNDECKFFLPLNLLKIEEWELLLRASSKTQAPILRNAINLLGKQNSNIKNKIIAWLMINTFNNSEQPVTKYHKIQNLKSKLGKDYVNIDAGYSSQYGNFLNKLQQDDFLNKLFEIAGDYKELSESINSRSTDFSINNLDELEEYIEYAIFWEEAHGNKQIRDYCSSLITRLKSLKSRNEFNFLNNTENYGLVNYIDNIVGDKNITIINFDNMDDEVINVVSSILSRVFFDYVKQQKERNSKPIHLVLDEAHRYISNTKGYEESFEANKIFERISKEARKYGLFLIISSQRPSEVNETVISQCNNFIIHRIQNPNDLSYIKSMTPFISESVIRQLPSIPRQEALVFGTATNLPVLFKVKDANPLPDSKNNEITKNWK